MGETTFHHVTSVYIAQFVHHISFNLSYDEPFLKIS